MITSDRSSQKDKTYIATMKETKTYPPWKNEGLAIIFFRMVTKRFLPASWYRAKLPPVAQLKTIRDTVNLEIVSHCWQYSNLLTYQLSSFVNFPPTKMNLTVTVFYCKEDGGTQEVLDFFGSKTVPNVCWNFQPLNRKKLFRRAIGRNMAAFSTKADWIWYTDCDLIFHENCLDSLADKLRDRQAYLLYPRQERITEMHVESDPMLRRNSEPRVIDIETDKFYLNKIHKAKGAFQIVHGDLARAIGYCDKLALFQSETEQWGKTYEDTAFRWLIGTEGEAIDVDNIFRIRHIDKGRYSKGTLISRVRGNIRRMQE